MQKNSSIRLQEELPENWESIEGLLVMHFGQSWSGASLFTQGIVAEVVGQYPQKLCAFEVDGERFKERFRVSQIPTVLIFQQGRIRASFVGLFPRHKLLETVENLLDLWDVRETQNRGAVSNFEPVGAPRWESPLPIQNSTMRSNLGSFLLVGAIPNGAHLPAKSSVPLSWPATADLQPGKGGTQGPRRWTPYRYRIAWSCCGNNLAFVSLSTPSGN